MKIGEVASACGVRVDTIRHYEARGALAERKLREVETRIGELLALRDSLTSTIERWDERLGATAEGKAAH